MAHSINELYSKYTRRIEKHLESDPYFNYLFELIQNSQIEMTQTERIVKKTVDENWLSILEETLPSIRELAGKPSRYMKTVDSLVPSDDIQNEEENEQFYDNRFLYTLIKKIVPFIDQHTDLIFWASNNEVVDVLNLSSKLKDDYEDITYNLELIIRNKNHYSENEEPAEGIYSRIDKARKAAVEMNRSMFSQLMKGTDPVKPPIKMTEAIANDENFKKCYELWKHIETWGESTYNAEIEEKQIPMDEEYLYQLYTNMAVSYTLFKSVLEQDSRIVPNIKKPKPETMSEEQLKTLVEDYLTENFKGDPAVEKIVAKEISKAQSEIIKKINEKLVVKKPQKKKAAKTDE